MADNSALKLERDPAEWLTDEQVATLLNIKVATLRYWRLTGEGPPWARMGPRLVRYSRADSLDWAKAQQRQHSSE